MPCLKCILSPQYEQNDVIVELNTLKNDKIELVDAQKPVDEDKRDNQRVIENKLATASASSNPVGHVCESTPLVVKETNVSKRGELVETQPMLTMSTYMPSDTNIISIHNSEFDYDKKHALVTSIDEVGDNVKSVTKSALGNFPFLVHFFYSLYKVI